MLKLRHVEAGSRLLLSETVSDGVTVNGKVTKEIGAWNIAISLSGPTKRLPVLYRDGDAFHAGTGWQPLLPNIMVKWEERDAVLCVVALDNVHIRLVRPDDIPDGWKSRDSLPVDPKVWFWGLTTHGTRVPCHAFVPPPRSSDVLSWGAYNVRYALVGWQDMVPPDAPSAETMERLKRAFMEE